MKNRRPESNEHPPAAAGYIALVPETDVRTVLESPSGIVAILRNLDEEGAAFRYAPEKWSVKELAGHVADGEKIFGYRALAIARGDSQSLPGWDEKTYTAAAQFDRWPVRDLADYAEAARKTTTLILRNLPEDAWDRIGLANNTRFSVRALAFTIAGHERHHLRVLRERYNVAGARAT